MPQRFIWQSEQAAQAVDRAAELLRGGELVVFPTDTVYKVASSLHANGIAKLQSFVGNDVQLELALSGYVQSLEYFPELSVLGQRLARRCWPGSVTIATAALENGWLASLADDVRTAIAPNGVVRLRVPDHDSPLETILQLGEPILFASVPEGDPGEAVSLFIDAGPCEDPRDATVVLVEGDTWRILSEGAVSEAELARLTPCHILFVCTGNTCRSPLAQALCTKLLAERLGCTATELPQRGFFVHSAGLSAMMGRGASAEAVAVAREYGAELSGHSSKPLTLEILRHADHLFLMTQGHLLALENLPPGVGPRPRLLSQEGLDVVDPFGGSIEEYRACAQQIFQSLQQLLPELE